MLEREKILNLQTGENPIGLTYPIVFADGKHFPERAKRVQQKRDLRKWNYPYEVFRQTKGIIDFDREVQVIAQELALMIGRSPAWSPDWPVITPNSVTEVTMDIPRL